MPALNFQAKFAEAVKSGTKRQTIRSYRKYPFKTGDRLFLYTGMRTSSCVKLGETVAQSVTEIRIFKNVVRHGPHRFCSGSCLNRFAKSDGFNNWQEMKAWFSETHGLPFVGQLITW